MGPESLMKRRRSPSVGSSSSSDEPDEMDPSPSRSPSPTPFHKYHRASPVPVGDFSYTCNLPPTCSQPTTSTSYATQAELDRHQETFHRWVCRTPIKDKVIEAPAGGVPQGFVSGSQGHKAWKECGKVFPEERFLQLHQTETHDPLTRARQARGEKIFQCFVPPPGCTKSFSTPARRRRHLIDKHRYPEQYFFAIIAHGINRIAEQDGLAISLIRPKKEYTRQPVYLKSSMSASSTNGTSVSGLPPKAAEGPAEQSAKSTETRTEPIREAQPDVEMDDLVADLGSSLQFIPKGVRKKQAAKA